MMHLSSGVVYWNISSDSGRRSTVQEGARRQLAAAHRPALAFRDPLDFRSPARGRPDGRKITLAQADRPE
jgi:hypothetical protein